MQNADRNTPLSGVFKSRKEGAMYTCTCAQSNDQCASYQCVRDTEDEENPEDESESTASPTSVQPSVKVTAVEPTSAEPEEKCRDTDTGILYSYGQKFTKVGTDGQQTCACGSDGEITCKGPLKNCPLPKSPEPSYDPSYMIPRGCYDPWDQSWHNNFASWSRKRLMNDAENEEDKLYGTYRCSCSEGVTQCSARDIPCCDRRTGEFVGGGQRFFTSMSGVDYMCTCRMQRGRFSDCLPESSIRKPAGSSASSSVVSSITPYVAPVATYRPVIVAQCRDRYRSGRRYDDGESWIQWRTRGGRKEPWTCTCKVTGQRARTQCRYGAR